MALGPHNRIIYGRRQPEPHGNLQRVFPLVMVLGGHRFDDGRHVNGIINRPCSGCALEHELSEVYRQWRQDVDQHHQLTWWQRPWRMPT